MSKNPPRFIMIPLELRFWRIPRFTHFESDNHESIPSSISLPHAAPRMNRTKRRGSRDSCYTEYHHSGHHSLEDHFPSFFLAINSGIPGLLKQTHQGNSHTKDSANLGGNAPFTSALELFYNVDTGARPLEHSQVLIKQELRSSDPSR